MHRRALVRAIARAWTGRFDKLQTSHEESP